MTRPAVVKGIWNYVKARDLQDHSNKRIILCDGKLEKVFKRKRVDCFQMNRYLEKHLLRDDEVAASIVGDQKSSKDASDDKAAKKADDSVSATSVPPLLLKLLPNLSPNVHKS